MIILHTYKILFIDCVCDYLKNEFVIKYDSCMFALRKTGEVAQLVRAQDS